MEAEELIQVFDRRWFESDIFDTRQRKQTSSVESVPDNGSGKEGDDDHLSVVLSRDRNVLVRSMSDQLAFSRMGFGSPVSVLLSRPGKEPSVAEEEEEEEEVANMMKERRKFVSREVGAISKSLSELEFEEVKGFADLGFVFSEEDKDTRLVEILPGLHRLSKKDVYEDGEVEKQQMNEAVPRPYLSESWQWWDRQRKDEEVRLRRRQRRGSMRWVAPVSGDISDIKRSLRMWAHNVASFVR